jgi:hypothetical protein
LISNFVRVTCDCRELSESRHSSHDVSVGRFADRGSDWYVIRMPASSSGAAHCEAATQPAGRRPFHRVTRATDPLDTASPPAGRVTHSSERAPDGGQIEMSGLPPIASFWRSHLIYCGDYVSVRPGGVGSGRVGATRPSGGSVQSKSQVGNRFCTAPRTGR